jgi:hypothetical protein
VLRIFIALKSQLSSVGFEPANLVSNGKHDDHYTIENDVGSSKQAVDFNLLNSRLGGVVVSVLAIGPKGRGFKDDRDEGLSRMINIRSAPSFEREVKPEDNCRKFILHVKNPSDYEQRYFVLLN